MSSIESIKRSVFCDAIVEAEFTYRVYPNRTEECHGIHTFEESDELTRYVLSVELNLEDVVSIDITDRLTEREKAMILKVLYDGETDVN